MARVISYLRFSSGKQEKGDSKRRQLENGQAWMKKHPEHTPYLHYQDLGKSAFRGKHRTEGQLAQLLKAIDDGKIEAGDTLLIENFDRLTREEISIAAELVLGILNRGITIVVLLPTERTYDKKSVNEGGLSVVLELVMGLFVSNEENRRKAQRVAGAWVKKRERVQNGQEYLNKDGNVNRKIPAWLTLDGNTIKPNDGAKAIKYIFERSCDGIGRERLLVELHERFSPIGYTNRWNGSYIGKILQDRSVLGELQPTTLDPDGKRITCDPIPNYYPRIISEDLWHRSQQAKAKRQSQRGPNRKFVSLFAGMVINARDKAKMHVRPAKGKNGQIKKRLTSSKHVCREPGACSISFDYFAFERHIVSALREVTPADLMMESKKKKTNKVAELQTELAKVERRLDEVQKAVEQSDDAVTTLLKAIGTLEKNRKLLARQIELEKQKTAVQDAGPLQEAQSVIELLEKNPNDSVLRLKLRAVLSGLIDSIYILPIKVSYAKVEAWVQINFASGGVRLLAMSKQHCMVMKLNGFDKLPHGMPKTLDLRTMDVAAWERTAKKYEKFA